METLQKERQNIYDLVDKLSPCIAISKKENFKKLKELLDDDRLEKITFVETPKTFNNKVGDDKVFLIPNRR